MLEQLQRRLIRGKKPDITENFRIFETLRQEAVLLGALPPKDPWEGVETCIRVAQVVNGVPQTSRTTRR
jgi:hypothetical protein